MYRTDCCPAHPVLLNQLSKVNTSCGLARQIFIYQWGAEVCGVQHIFMSDWRALVTPPEGHPGQLAYTFLIRILQTSFVSVSIFSVCCYSRVSISMSVPPCLAQNRTGIGLLGKPPAVKQFPPTRANRRTCRLRDPRANASMMRTSVIEHNLYFAWACDRGINQRSKLFRLGGISSC